ncbi:MULTISPECIES: fimbrial protein [unclassified Pseudomonas]|jgi:major type 1 subunit fimbrin (pilin)|uniref:fimbrial protein n=1 Tax=unclassified Pseudomonas TaxID=196821 RepID=UPI000ED5DF76|nr:MULTISPECIES: fimbrial protein [unclassified Pseudomonas]MCS4250035.1 major type 1 subunit fimbrin (pilin) [Pseudomonas sp. BIGb0164]NVZ52577.1 fimbrial protein [Pseudomonas sp. B6002]NWE23663.1 fimbrial protein [Pseudomonas sp. P7548]HCT07410.1 fimbrial protein [Pseudomonas sp.]
MKKLVAVTAATVVMGLASFANAATPATGNPGTVRFIGEIVSGACGIDANSLDQTVSLGQVPSNQFKAIGDRSTPTKFDIVLTECDTSTQKNARFTFSGVQDPVVPGLFATTGLAQNVGIRLQASAGEMLDNGTEQVAPVVLQDGNNTVTFAAMYEATAASVTTGEADSVANFTVAYN